MKSTMSVSLALVFVALFAIATIINISFCGANSYVGCIETERESLLKFKQDLKDPSNRLASWNIGDGDCCKWAGVVCSNFTGHVIQLNLRNPFCVLGSGTEIEAYKRSKLVGKINPSLVDLKHLIHLDLSCNGFSKLQIPKFIGSLKNLRYPNLSRSEFTGIIPHQHGNFSNLQYPDLNSLLDGGLHVDNISWVSGLSLLEHLDLSGVNLSKAYDSLLSINSLHSLSVLKLSFCGLPHFPPLSSVNFSSLNTLDLSGNYFDNSLFHRWVFGFNHLVFLDLSFNQFQGQIPSELGHLTSLRHLDLSSNQFNSTRPGWLSKLNDLEFISIRDNNLQGAISSIGLENLTSIETLDLSYNEQLQGKIPNSLARLCKLSSIDISYVKLSQDLSQVLDIFSACGASALESLRLSRCQISGQLTDQLKQFKSLHTLFLNDNSLSGQLPPALGELSSLTYLDLSNNTLNGTLSEIHFVNLTKLTLFSTSGNSLILKVNRHWIPPFQLETLQLRSCHLGPQFPLWLHSQKHLVGLDISNTKISDTVPHWFWNSIPQYQYLNLSSNQIYGEILDFGCALPLTLLMYGLDLSNNALSGSIFHLVCHNLPNIKCLKLSNNRFSGDIPNYWMNSPDLRVLKLANNNFTGSLPISIGTLTSLWSLNLRNNSLSGIIPVSLQNCTKLVTLDMAENEFVGHIPTWIGEGYLSLKVLNLRSNKFYGVFPIQLCRLSSLQILDVAYNRLSGSIPRCINNFTTMVTAYSSNQGNDIHYPPGPDFRVVEDASIVMKGFMVEYSSILNLVRSIDMSKNKFSGEIPLELTDLKGLQSLNLSHNCFIGKIPENIGNMRSIESFDFSMNQLSGKIPQSMSSLSFLNHLNLSNNNLIGKIPSSTQLQSFGASCFAGNDLCGTPLPNCTEINDFVRNDPKGNGNEAINEVKWFYVSMALGFVVGFWCFIGPLLTNRRWRFKYCHFLDGFVYKFGCFVRKCY